MARTIVLCVLCLGVLMTGCKKEDAETLDEEAILSLLNDSPFFATSEHYEGEPVSDSGDTNALIGDAMLMDSITPVLWGRAVTSHPDPTLIVEIVGDSAHVAFEGHNAGLFQILVWNPDTGWVLLDKTLGETVWIEGIFKRLGSTDEPDRGWELTDVTGVLGESDSVQTVGIDSARIETDNYPDTVFLDPMEYIDVNDVLTYDPGDDVTLTVYANDSTALAFVHVFIAIWPYHIRLPLEHIGGRAFQNAWPWRVANISGVRLMVLDLISHPTLWSDENVYDANGWMLPYQVE
jgi:hypothetical protein